MVHSSWSLPAFTLPPISSVQPLMLLPARLYDPVTVMFFFRNKHMMIDLGTGVVLTFACIRELRRAVVFRQQQQSELGHE